VVVARATEIQKYEYFPEAAPESALQSRSTQALELKEKMVRGPSCEGTLVSNDASFTAAVDLGPSFVWREDQLQRAFINMGGQGYCWTSESQTWTPPLPSPVTCQGMRADLSASGNWLAQGGFHDGNFFVWDTRPGAPVKPLYSERFSRCPLPAFSPDERWLAIRGSDALSIVRTSDWQRIAHFPQAVGYSGSVIWTPDSQLLLYQKDHISLTFLQAPNWQESLNLEPPLGQDLEAASISPDGNWLFSTMGYDGLIMILNLAGLRHELGMLGIDWP
jgi:WD40 repeat protein